MVRVLGCIVLLGLFVFVCTGYLGGGVVVWKGLGEVGVRVLPVGFLCWEERGLVGCGFGGFFCLAVAWSGVVWDSLFLVLVLLADCG